MEILFGLFIVVSVATFGGIVAKLLRLPNLVGFIIAGIFFGTVIPEELTNIASLAELGTILLLFSIGLELSFGVLSKYLKLAVIGSLIQIVVTTVIFLLLLNFLDLSLIATLVLAMGFSLSSTAVAVKMLSERGEIDTIHGQIMMGWLLVQDLAVVPMMVSLPIIQNGGDQWFSFLALSLGKAFLVVILIVLIGKIAIPYLVKKISDTNSRELLLLSALAVAFGTALISSFFGVSPALGAFLAGVVISEGQENHAIFAETRPLRDLFMALFFVTLGFLVDPTVIFSNFVPIILISLAVLVIKTAIVTYLTGAFGYKGKTSIMTGFGLSHIGEFAFVLFSTSLALGILSSKDTSFGISVTLVTLIIAPILYKFSLSFWRRVKHVKFFSSGEGKVYSQSNLINHIVIVGYGRVGKWVGRAFSEFGIPFVVVEYDKSIVNHLKKIGVNVFYGDPSEPEVMEAVNIREAKLLILAIPDRPTQESLISYTQTHAPHVKIISRVHSDNDWEKLKNFQVHKLVQPEFEASIEIIRSVLRTQGRLKDDINAIVKSLRVSHSK